MNPFLIYLTDVLSCLNTGLYTQIYFILKAWFDPIARGANFSDAQILWAPAIVPLSNDQLLVHFVPQELSIVSQLSGSRIDPQARGHWGVTAWATPQGASEQATASEVYVKDLNAEILSKLVFHECMHNKLHLDNQALHPGNPPRVDPALGLASAILDSSTNLVPANTTAMAGALRTPRKQWTDAVPRLLQHRARRDIGDPVWYM
jgi:hypothetical protein